MILVGDLKQQKLKDTIQKDESPPKHQGHKTKINLHIYCIHRIGGKRDEIEDKTYLEEIFESSKILSSSTSKGTI